eukprot:gene13387-biopygen9558
MGSGSSPAFQRLSRDSISAVPSARLAGTCSPEGTAPHQANAFCGAKIPAKSAKKPDLVLGAPCCGIWDLVTCTCPHHIKRQRSLSAGINGTAGVRTSPRHARASVLFPHQREKRPRTRPARYNLKKNGRVPDAPSAASPNRAAARDMYLETRCRGSCCVCRPGWPGPAGPAGPAGAGKHPRWLHWVHAVRGVHPAGRGGGAFLAVRPGPAAGKSPDIRKIPGIAG